MPTELPNERAIRAPGSMELDPSGEGLAVEETPRLIASLKVEGTAVFDRAGEQLGEIYTLMLDKVSGQVAYAVMSFGGFLGLGERYHPLAWRSLTYDTKLGGYVVDLDKAALVGSATNPADETPAETLAAVPPSG